MAGILSLAQGLSGSILGRTGSVNLWELDDQDALLRTTGSYLRFQYWPDTISDSKGVNYKVQEIPGGSLPLYQWIASGERTISFQCVFSTDVDISINGATLAPPPSDPSGIFQRLIKSGQGDRNIDVRSAVIWLRRFLIPSYGNNGKVGVPQTNAPHKCILEITGSGIGLAGGDSGLMGDDQVLAVMTQCEVTWDSFFPSGFPRTAMVSLGFAQVAQFQNAVFFPSVTDAMNAAVDGSKVSPAYYGYKLPPKSPSNGIG